MLFAGVDPGSESYAFAVCDELGRIVKYFEIPSDLILHDSFRLTKYLANFRPSLIALPSGHGLPFIKARDLNNREIFLLTLSNPEKEGNLREFLKSSKILPGITIPSVIELESVPEFRKINRIDMGTADKVSTAFFYRTMYDNFVLVEMGRHFSAIIIVKDGKIIDGFGGTEVPGIISPGSIDGEIVYLLQKYSKISKETIYNGSNKRRAIEIIRIIAEWYSEKYKLKIIISGPSKDEISFGEKMNFKFKEAAVGASFIANAIGGGELRKFADMLNSSGEPINYVKLKGWEEVISWTKTLL
ncbi:MULTISPECIES: DUF1464 family protein [Acidianus]|uniref:Acetate kinase n=1 Tax=Candidatus Acidianus copahuensis TaxID=1160895 RepID=A0A031LKG2_9CREN|nr:MULTISPECIES: DUF1464 family protein [Acidianus]EZQ03828.1 acetate kinase [Candidatus Acidianus copahuensis]NON62691.1 DUF1464 family protein [Acidianus sp. RZ1]